MLTTLLNKPVSTLLRIGLLVFATYVALVALGAWLTFSEVQQWLPPDDRSGAKIGFYVSLLSGATGELMALGLGWLLILAMVVLVDGHVDGRQLLAVIGCCYAPLVAYPLAVTLALLGGVVDASSLAGISDGEVLAREIAAVVPLALEPLKPVRYVSVAAALVLAWVAIRGACRLNGTRTALVLGTYVLFTVLLSRMAS